MAHISFRVSGVDRTSLAAGKPARRVARTFADDDGGHREANSFARQLAEVETTWYVRLRFDGQRASRKFAKRDDALRYAKSFETDRDRGVAIDPRAGDMAFETFARNWLESDPSKRPSTRARDRAIVERHLVPALGTTPLRRIKLGDVQTLVNDWTATLQPSTVGRQFKCLQAIMSSAIRHEKIGKSPCVGIKLPETTRRRKLILDPLVLAELAAELAPDGAMAYVGAALGLRWGEVAGLRVDDVDLDNAVVSIGHQRTRGEHGRMVEGAPKSAAGVRTMAMPAGLVAILRDHLEARGISELEHGSYLFAGPKGGPLHYSNWRRRVWLPACSALGPPTAFASTIFEG